MIRFLWSEGVSWAESHGKFLTQYRNSARPKSSVYERIEKFKNGRTNVDHWKHSDLPVKKKFKTQRSAGKVIPVLTIFGLKKPILKDTQISAESPCIQPRPSDYYLFSTLKNPLQSRRFSLDKAVLETVHKWLQKQPKTFFSDKIYKLVNSWNKCIKKNEKQVEK